MFNAIKKVRSLATSVFRPNGLTLTIFLILSLIADGAAQSSSQVASAVSQTASVASQVVSAASQASLQASSQADSQSPSQTLAQTGPQPSVSALPSTANSIISFDDSCKAEHRDMLDNDLKDVMDMANVTVKSQIAYTDNPNFWLFFGQSSVEHIPVIKSVFPGVLQLSEPISVRCNFDRSAPCDDRTNFPGIAKTVVDTRKRDGTQGQQPGLVICPEYFGLPPLNHRVQMGINSPTNLTARYNSGYYHDNRGE